MTTSDGPEPDFTLGDYKKVALEQLREFGAMFDDPEFRRVMGDELADGIKAINDEKITEIEEMPDA